MIPSLLRVLLLLVSLLVGGSLRLPAEKRISTVVSIAPQQWLVEQIGGDAVEVEVLVLPGASPATYSPTDIQVTSLMKAQIFFRIGVPFEKGPWFDALRKMGRFTLVDLREGLADRGQDPHIWLVPELLSIQATTVAEALVRQDPTRSDLFAENLRLFQARMASLNRDLAHDLAPYEGRAFFVFHPSWTHFAQAYGLRQVALEIDGREPSDQQLTRLRTQALEEGITMVFVQPQIHERSARAFAESIGARIETLDPLAADIATNLDRTVEKLLVSFGDSLQP